jgi:FkbM family methyltransferase
MINENLIKYYSANGEDYLLWHFFEFKKDGLFLDVGAFDGIHFSNTYSFELQGWKGVCMEPNPVYFSYLTQRRPASICLRCACVSDRTKHETTMFCEELGLLSTTNKTPDYENFVEERYKKRDLTFDGLKPALVPAVTIDETIDRYFHKNDIVDIVSIDVEGAEMDVLKGFDVSRRSPKVLVIESNRSEQTEEIVSYMASAHRYLYAGKLVENLFFVKTEAEVEKIRSIRIDCAIEPQLHPLGERFTTGMYLKGRIIKEKTIKLK